MRKAIVKGELSLDRVRAYLPENFTAHLEKVGSDWRIVIQGQDFAGWTLDDYVIPRLASGLIFAEEVK